MDDTLIKALCDSINLQGGSVPALPIPEIYPLIETLFTEEEAKLAAKMPAGSKSYKDLAKDLEIPEEKMYSMLEAMADKGVVATGEKTGRCSTRSCPLSPVFLNFSLCAAGRQTKIENLPG